MKKKLFAVLSALTVCVSGAAFAAPQTTFQEGAVQVDVGAWNPKSDIGDFSSDSNWNFQGGITYGLTDDVAIQYQYAVTPDLDINAGYRYVDTEGRHGNDPSVTYKGFVTGISYRFGGF